MMSEKGFVPVRSFESMKAAVKSEEKFDQQMWFKFQMYTEIKSIEQFFQCFFVSSAHPYKVYPHDYILI